MNSQSYTTIKISDYPLIPESLGGEFVYYWKRNSQALYLSEAVSIRRRLEAVYDTVGSYFDDMGVGVAIPLPPDYPWPTRMAHSDRSLGAKMMNWLSRFLAKHSRRAFEAYVTKRYYEIHKQS